MGDDLKILKVIKRVGDSIGIIISKEESMNYHICKGDLVEIQIKIIKKGK